MVRSLSFLLPGMLGMALVVPFAGPFSGSPRVDQSAIPADAPKPRTHPLSDEAVATAAATIDRMINTDLTIHQQQANPAIDDYTFVRRAYLTIVGRIPTVAEAAAFNQSADKDRRGKLLTLLQQQPGRVHNDFTWWADLLRISTRLGNRYPGNAYVDWIKEQIRTNQPYDQIARALITAEGPALARGNGATGYYLRDAGMPLDNMANTVQVFLGTRIQCAQCHDHPFDKWTRKQFYELAAYTDSVDVNRDVKGLGQINKKLKEDGASQEIRNALRMIGDTVALRVRGGDKPVIELPKDYQYHDAKPGEKVSAKTIFGSDGRIAKGDRAKLVYADWMTSPDNPRFTQVIANRIWKRAFGVGVIEPVDNLTDKTEATNPELMAFLTKLMISVDYDLMRFQRILYQTDAWQRASSSPDSIGSEPYRFAGPVQRRMTAEQLWDSLLTLGVPELDQRVGESAERLYKFYEDNKDKDAKGLLALAQDLGERRSKLRAIEIEARSLRELIAAAKNKDDLEPRKAKARLKELADLREQLADQTEPERMVVFKKNGKGPDQFVRADELPSPAPAGHFLRTFGQSDRDVIEAGNNSPATTQALTMLNGFVDKELLKERSVLYQDMLKPPDMGGKIDVLFLAILSRPPSLAERELGKQELAHALLTFRKENKAGMSTDVAKESAKSALHNLAWVLVNSNEFLFVQ